MRLGVLVPAGNPTIEPGLYRMAPRSLTIHFARLETLAGEPGGVDGMERRTLGYLDSVPAAAPSPPPAPFTPPCATSVSAAWPWPRHIPRRSAPPAAPTGRRLGSRSSR